MARIRLLTSVQGDGPVFGDPGDVLDVQDAVARVWADGERAERVESEASGMKRTRVRQSGA
jgi:hypothetical protein